VQAKRANFPCPLDSGGRGGYLPSCLLQRTLASTPGVTMHRHLLIALLMLGVAAARGQEPEKKKADDKPAPKKVEENPDEAPAPRALPGETIVLPYYHQRINRWDRWQYVSVAHSNQWRPRVIYSPNGAYYLYNGKPYPWMPVISTNIQATEVGTPYRAAPARMPYCED
jgi:hypothetical protein